MLYVILSNVLYYMLNMYLIYDTYILDVFFKRYKLNVRQINYRYQIIKCLTSAKKLSF